MVFTAVREWDLAITSAAMPDWIVIARVNNKAAIVLHDQSVASVRGACGCCAIVVAASFGVETKASVFLKSTI